MKGTEPLPFPHLHLLQRGRPTDNPDFGGRLTDNPDNAGHGSCRGDGSAGSLSHPSPYWQSSDGAVTLYHGDCLDVLTGLPAESVSCVVTDPPWPKGYWPDAMETFRQAAVNFPRLARRAVIHLGCDSDPRILAGMPIEMPFLRVCWLEYPRPHYKGRLLYTGDVAYIFGEPPPIRKGQFLMPGKVIATDSYRERVDHPCPREPQFVAWLLKWFGGDGPILDPFCGAGTTCAAAARMGLPAIGIDLSQAYLDAAIPRIERAILEREHGVAGAALVEAGQGALL